MLNFVFSLNQELIVRILLSFLTAFIMMLSCGKRFIEFLHIHQSQGQPIRECGPQSHLQTKKGTPTMGGILLLAAILFSSLLWANLQNIFVWLCIAVIIIFGGTGFADDYIKVKKHTPDAMTAKMKLLLQFTTAFIVVYIVCQLTPADMRYGINIPYINYFLNLWWFYIPFAMVVITGASNAVNLSDGLDGLASGLSLLAFASFAIIAYITGTDFEGFLHNLFIPGSGEIAVICAATIGACLGFLWFNCLPAQVFMGDTGSLALGALLGTVAVITRHELLLAVIGFIFVLEALSVIIQVFWYKRTQKRVFLMAPIHHHFEQLGWKEATVVIRFWIIAAVCAVTGLISLTM